MGAIAEMVIGGVICQLCGDLIDEGDFVGYPRTCDDCEEIEGGNNNE